MFIYIFILLAVSWGIARLFSKGNALFSKRRAIIYSILWFIPALIMMVIFSALYASGMAEAAGVSKGFGGSSLFIFPSMASFVFYSALKKEVEEE